MTSRRRHPIRPLSIDGSTACRTTMQYRLVPFHKYINNLSILKLRRKFKLRTIQYLHMTSRACVCARQERFRTITTAYYRGAMGIMLVYDITNEKSFDNIKNCNIEEHASADVEKMVLGNKCDMNDKRQVSKERGEQLAIEYGIKFMETSAKASINVEESFFNLARDIKSKMEKKLRCTEPPSSRHIIATKLPGQAMPSRLSRTAAI
ncbi:unnamed protein product, partial [Meganyctiphanes norvegica]